MKSIYPIIKASATKHPYQWAVTKLGINRFQSLTVEEVLTEIFKMNQKSQLPK